MVPTEQRAFLSKPGLWRLNSRRDEGIWLDMLTEFVMLVFKMCHPYLPETR